MSEEALQFGDVPPAYHPYIEYAASGIPPYAMPGFSPYAGHF